MRKNYDVIILGCGISGITLALEFIKTNKKVAIVENGKLGGVTYNCSLIIFNIFEFIRKIKSDNSLSIAYDSVELDDKILEVLNKYDINKNRLMEYYLDTFIQNGIDVFRAKGVLKNENLVELDNEEIIRGEIIILASGKSTLYKYSPMIYRAYQKKIIINDCTSIELLKTRDKIAILGSNFRAVELAIVWSNLGRETILFSPRNLLYNIDLDLREKYLNNLDYNFLTVYENIEVIDIVDFKVIFKIEDEIHSLKIETLIDCEKKEFNEKFVENLNIEHTERGIIVNDVCKTNIPNIYAVGDINNKSSYFTTAISDSQRAFNDIIGRRELSNRKMHVHVLKGITEYSFIGKNELQLKAENSRFICHTIYYDEEEWVHDLTRINYVKILFEPYNFNILGLHVIGSDAGESIEEILNVINAKYNEKAGYVSAFIKKSHMIGNMLLDFIYNKNKEFVDECHKLFFQFQYGLNGMVNGMEVLSRFQIEDRIVSPLEYIINYEKNGFIIEFDKKIYKKTVKFIKSLMSKGAIMDDFHVSINISPMTIKYVDSEYFLNIAKSNGVPTNIITIEVTERIIDSVNFVKEELQSFMKMGFKLSLDDFSIGNASLIAVKEIGFDEVKIDYGLLDSIVNLENRNMYEMIVGILNQNNVRIVSEGVETKEEYEFLLDLKIDSMQGFYLSKPKPEKDVIQYFHDIESHKE